MPLNANQPVKTVDHDTASSCREPFQIHGMACIRWKYEHIEHNIAHAERTGQIQACHLACTELQVADSGSKTLMGTNLDVWVGEDELSHQAVIGEAIQTLPN